MSENINVVLMFCTGRFCTAKIVRRSINQSINQSCIFRVVQVINHFRIHWRWGRVYRGSVIMSGNGSVWCLSVRLSVCPVVVNAAAAVRHRRVGFDSVLFSIFSMSSAILVDSSTESPVHVLMLSIQAVRGLPRLRAPGVVPCIISFSRQLPCFLMV